MSSPRPGLIPSFRLKSKPMEEPQVTPLSELGPQCEAQRERIRRLFENGAGARETLRQLCELADGTIKKVFGELLRVRSGPGQGLTLLALGGYGREMLFPYSDLDLLFLFGTRSPRKSSARSSPSFPALYGTSVFASARPDGRWRNAATSKNPTLNSILRCSIAGSLTAMFNCSKSWTQKF